MGLHRGTVISIAAVTAVAAVTLDTGTQVAAAYLDGRIPQVGSTVQLEQVASGQYVIRGAEVLDPTVRCMLWNSAAQSIPNNVATAITFDTEFEDPYAMHSTTSNTSRIVVPAGYGGLYHCSGSGGFAAAAGGIRWLYFGVNATSLGFFPYLQEDNAPNATNGTRFTTSGYVQLNDGDYIQLVVFQNATGGVALNTLTGPNPSLVVVRVAA